MEKVMESGAFYLFAGQGLVCTNVTEEEMAAAEEAGIFSYPEHEETGCIDDSLLGIQVRKTIRHNNYFNQSRGHKVNNSYSKRKRPKKPGFRAGKGFRFRPELPAQPMGFDSSDIAHEAYNKWEDYCDGHDCWQRYSADPGKLPNQTVPKVEWAAERGWRNRNNRRRKAARRKERGSAEALKKMRKEIRWYTEPGLSPPNRGYSRGWW
jgi:hypothetical protein